MEPEMIIWIALAFGATYVILMAPGLAILLWFR
jgi:hypothetical protein